MTRNEPLRLGVVGLGHVARHLIEAAGDCREIIVAAGCDPVDERKGLLPEGAQFFRTADEFFEHADIHVAIIAAPTPKHFELAKSALEAGRAVAVEKPAVLTIEEYDALLAIARRTGTFLDVAVHAAFAADVLAFQSLISSGEIDLGALAAVHGGFFDPHIAGGAADPEAARSLLGPWLDSGINALSVVDCILEGGCLTLREARRTRLPGLRCEEADAVALLEWTDSDSARPVPIFIETNWSLGLNRKRTVFYFERGDVTLDHSAETVRIRETGSPGSVRVIRCSDGRPRLVRHYANLLDDLCARLRSGEPNFAELRPIHGILFQVRESAEAGAG